MIAQALLSVADKTGIVELARALAALGVRLLSTGGTALTLRQAGLSVRDVSEITGYPEMLGGRVKTLHPTVHAGILAARDEQSLAELAQQQIEPIDLVVVNLYPFQETVARPGATLAGAIENIDIGGVTLLRAAAKNHAFVTVLSDPADYSAVLSELRSTGGVGEETRRRLAYRAFAHTAAYDAAIAAYLAQQGLGGEGAFPPYLRLAFDKVRDLRYGENPHQAAALYRQVGAGWPGLADAQLLHGKELSFNNIMDLEAAWRAAYDLPEAGIVIVKHGNPCGAATAGSLARAYEEALACDPQSAFGGVIAANRPLDEASARLMATLFVEAIVAPAFDQAALDILRRKKDCRLVVLQPPQPLPAAYDMRRVHGGLLVQSFDDQADDPSAWRVATQRSPTEDERRALAFAWLLVKHVKSNAIVLARQSGPALATVGVGAGQMSRVDAVRLAVAEAGQRAAGAALASDAFFPFADGVEAACAAGVTAIVQPGGSLRDDESIAVADRYGAAMLFTGARHFRH